MVLKKLPPLILGSQSPRRRQLLEALGIEFSVCAPEIEEQHGKVESVDRISIENARAKARQVCKKVNEPSAICLGADTLVVLSEHVLGKPSNTKEAEQMLRMLSGRVHRVVTGLAMCSIDLGSIETAVSTDITFRELTPQEVKQYCSTREPYDKAGAYAVQGLASLFITRVEGSYTNVIGLPIEEFLRGLEKLSGISTHQWFQ